jgi:hypothetical protein
MMKHISPVFAILCACLLVSTSAMAQEESGGAWPREIVTEKGTVVIYQPQPEKLEGDLLSGRAAVAVELKENKEPVFGALWFKARLETDRANRTATITQLDVTEVRFPEQDDAMAKKVATLLEREILGWDLPIDMDRLLTTLEFAEKRLESTEKIETRPPKILISREPAVLITLDGDPRLVEEKGSSLKRVVNTPFTLLYNPSGKMYWLYADVDSWYTAGDIKGDWTLVKNIPAEVAARAPKPEPEEEEAVGDDAETKETEPGPPPKIVISTEPAELIVFKGEPEYTPITGTDLLYASNTDSDVLMDIGSQQHYVLLSGRWYAGSGLEGPWKFVPGEDLPDYFADIPEDSQMGTVLYAVPGTDVAKEAVLDAQIPQTAAVDPKKASLAVEYDGKPKFEPIKDTKMTYAINTATPIIFAEKKYYACDQAVWFVADRPEGPWAVATMIPAVIYTIPPDSPLYNVTYVHIYKATPEVVYVGYTPGYTSTYVYHNTIVYGTGYYWPGWYGSYYYPRPSTWGFHVRYNPWSGWGFGVSYSSGPFTFSMGGGGWYRGGWWGPSRYRGYNRGYSHGYRHGAHRGYRAGYNAGRRHESRDNLYRNTRNEGRTLSDSQRADARSRASSSRSGTRSSRAATASSRPNNVYAGRNGEVYRQTDKGWQQRSGDNWKNKSGDPSQAGRVSQSQKDQASQRAQSRDASQASRQTQSRQPSQAQRDQASQRAQSRDASQASQRAQSYKASGGSRSSTQQLNSSSQARQRGSQRTSSYNQSRSSSSSRSRPSGGGSSGGGSRGGGSRGGGGRGGGGRR